MKIDKEQKLKSELKAPNGYRHIKFSELVKEFEEGNKKLKNDWYWVEYKGIVGAVRFDVSGGRFRVYGFILFEGNLGRSRGVWVKK